MKAAKEPGLDKFHIPIDCCFRTLHQCSCFLRGATEEVAQFHKLYLVGVNRIQFIQCPIEFEKIFAADINPREVITQWNVNVSASTHLRLISPSVIDKNPAHHLGGKRIEMAPVIVRDFFLVQELQVEFVHQDGRLQEIGVSLPANVCRGDLTQMGIDKRHKLIED